MFRNSRWIPQMPALRHGPLGKTNTPPLALDRIPLRDALHSPQDRLQPAFTNPRRRRKNDVAVLPQRRADKLASKPFPRAQRLERRARRLGLHPALPPHPRHLGAPPHPRSSPHWRQRWHIPAPTIARPELPALPQHLHPPPILGLRARRRRAARGIHIRLRNAIRGLRIQ